MKERKCAGSIEVWTPHVDRSGFLFLLREDGSSRWFLGDRISPRPTGWLAGRPLSGWPSSEARTSPDDRHAGAVIAALLPSDLTTARPRHPSLARRPSPVDHRPSTIPVADPRRPSPSDHARRITPVGSRPRHPHAPRGSERISREIEADIERSHTYLFETFNTGPCVAEGKKNGGVRRS